MNCQSLRNWLLQVESLQPKTWPPDAVTHLKTCARCVKFVNALNKVEKSWRNQPMPASCGHAKAAFLGKLEAQAKSVPVKLPARRWRPARWAAVAAMLLVAVGLLTWALVPSESRASDVVDRLVDLNTDLTKADFGKRKQLLDSQEESLRKRLQESRLSVEERANADFLLQAAQKLAASDDLEEDEEIITELAKKLLERAKNARSKGSEKESEHCSDCYELFLKKAVNPLHSKLRIIDRLIELNMEMASADAKKRKQLLEENLESLREDLRVANLPPDEHAMALKLLEVSQRMADNSDPGVQARAITEVADNLLQRMQAAEKKGKKNESDRAAIGYSIFIEKALNPYFTKLKASQPKGPPDGKKGGFDFSKYQKQFEVNRQRGPQFRGAEMHKRFEAQTKMGLGGLLFKSGSRR